MAQAQDYTATTAHRPLGWMGAVLTASLAPALWMLLVAPARQAPAGSREASVLVEGLLAWSTGGAALFAGLLAWNLRFRRCGRLFRGAAVGLFVAAAAEGALGIRLLAGMGGPDAPRLAAGLWLLAGLGCALASLGAGRLVARPSEPTRRGSVLASLVLAVVGSGALLWVGLGGGTGLLLPRPWELVPLAAFVATWPLVTRPLLRRWPSPALRALELSLIPMAVAQVHAALSPLGGTGQTMAAGLRLFALGVLLVGWVREHRRVQVDRRELEALREDLERQRSDLTSSQQRLSGEIQVRREMEAGLRMLRKAVETTQLGITLTDPEGKILYANPAQAKMFGVELENLIGRPSSIFGPKNRRQPMNPEALDQLQGLQREGINVRQDGTLFPVRLSSDAVRDTEGVPVGVVTICEDITERKQVERELERRGAALEAVSFAAEWFLRSRHWQESLDQLLAALGSALDVSRIFVLANRYRDGKLAAWRMVQEWAAQEGRMIAKGEAVSMESSGVEELRRHLRTGRTWIGSTPQLPEALQALFPDGHFAHLLLSPVFAGEDPWGVIGLADENPERQWTVSEMESLATAARILGAALVRQRYEEALQQSEERFRDLFENASDLIQSVDLEGNFQFVNRSWLRTLGYTREEVARLKFQDIIAPDHLEHCMEIFQQVLGGETFENLETVFLTRQGDQVVVEGSTSCYYRNGKPQATRGIFHNITERREVDRLKSDFISMVSHELRTPLTSIYASLQLLAGGSLGELPPQTRQLVEIADKNSQRLVRLVEDIIDVERIESGHIPFRRQVVDLLPIVRQALEANEAYGQRYGVRLALAEGGANPAVRVDTDRLMQVLTNLLSNAVKFSPKDGRVEVRIVADEETVRVEVADQGPGIPEEFREKIFQRFVQVDSVHTRSKEGSGLGLSIARSIVQRLDGSIDFRSRPEGGTIFYFEIPVWKDGGTPQQPAARQGVVLHQTPAKGTRVISDS